MSDLKSPDVHFIRIKNEDAEGYIKALSRHFFTVIKTDESFKYTKIWYKLNRFEFENFLFDLDLELELFKANQARR